MPEGGVLRVLSHQRTELPGWPVYIDEVIWSSPSIGDIDNDGQLEVVVGTGIFYRGGKGEYINAYEMDGSPVSGWPVSVSIGRGLSQVFASPALADVNGDDTLKVFVGDMQGYLHAIKHDGTKLWSITPADAFTGVDDSAFAFFSSPVVGDIDGDGEMEVVIGGGWHVTAVDALTGDFESGYPAYTGPDTGGAMQTWSVPAIADFDGDNLIEIVIGTGRKALPDDKGGIRVFHETGDALADGAEIGSTGVAVTLAPWPKFKADGPGTSTVLKPAPPVAIPDGIDVDGNGAADALTDGLLILRYLFGFQGDTLVGGAVGGGCQNCTSAEVTAKLDAIKDQLDVDGNGSVDALTDGVIILRALFGFTGSALTNGAVGSGCTRCNVTEITEFLNNIQL